jgi:hypothetical protein
MTNHKHFITLICFVLLHLGVYGQTWEWVNSFGNKNYPDAVEFAEQDAVGNIFMLGTFTDSIWLGDSVLTSDHDYAWFLAKTDTIGNPLWMTTIESDNQISIVDMGVDSAGRVYVGGNFTDSLFFPDGSSIYYSMYSGFISQFSSDGKLLYGQKAIQDSWLNSFTSSTPALPLLGMALSESDGLHITCAVSDRGVNVAGLWVRKSYDGPITFTVQLNDQFEAIWAKKITDKIGYYVSQYGEANFLYITDSLVFNLFNNSDVNYWNITSKTRGELKTVDSELQEVPMVNYWNFHGEVINDTEFVSGFDLEEVLRNSSPFPKIINDIEYTPSGESDIMLVKYDDNLEIEWVKQIGGAFEDRITDVETDSEGNIYISGYFQNQITFPGQTLYTTGQDMFIAKYSIDGDFMWVQQFGSGSTDVINSISVDDDGDILVAGQFSYTAQFPPFSVESSGKTDGFIAKLSCKPAQPEPIMGESTVCIGEAMYSTRKTSGVDYNWSLSGGGTLVQSDTSCTIQWTDTGTFEIKVTPSGVCGIGESRVLIVSVKDVPKDLLIDGQTSACIGSATYTVKEEEGTSYAWELSSGGELLPIDNSAVITWTEKGTHTIQMISSNECGNAMPESKTVMVYDVPSQVETINGVFDVCVGTYTYSTELIDSIGYDWNVDGGVYQEFDNTVTVTWADNGLHSISVRTYNECGTSDKTEQTVTVNKPPLKPSTILGNTSLCLGTEVYSVQAVEEVEYHWSVSDGGMLIKDGATVTVHWVKEGVFQLTVQPENDCGLGESRSITVEVSDIPTLPDSIFGLTDVCVGKQEYSIEAQTDEIYTWSLGGGGVLAQDGNYAYVDWSESGKYSLSVMARNSCGISETKTTQIQVRPSISQIDGITGEKKVCLETQLYSVPKIALVTYDWFLQSGGTITENENEVEIVWDSVGLHSLRVSSSDGCASISHIQVNDAPKHKVHIGGDSLVCAGESVYTAQIYNNTWYRWELNEPIELKSYNNISSVKWDSIGTFSLKLTPYNECGDGEMDEQTITVQEVPTIPSEILGDNLVCVNQAYEYSVENDVLSKNKWFQLEHVILISDENTTEAVFLKEGNFTLQANAYNICGASAVVGKDIQAISSPEFLSIHGESVVCEGVSQYYVSLGEHETVRWEVEGNVTYKLAGDTIFVNWTTSGFYEIKAYVENFCGSAPMAKLNVQVLPTP